MKAPKPPRCRVCRRTPGETWFSSVSPRLCMPCRTARQAERRARQAALPAPPRVRRAPDPARNEAHLAWVRGLPCCVAGRTCTGPIEAHHVRAATGGGTGKKPPDRWAVPLCHGHHVEGHRIGWHTFEARHTVDLRQTAERLARLSPHVTPGQPTSLPSEVASHLA